MFTTNLINIKLFYALVFCLMTAAAQTQAAVTVDSRGSGGAANVVGLSSISWSHTVSNGANRALFVGVATATTNNGQISLPADRVASVTYNGTALTRVGTVISGNTLNSTELFILVNPAVGTNNIVVNFTVVAGITSVFVNQSVGNSVSFFGVSQTTPTGALFSATGNNTSPTVTASGSVAGDYVVDNLAASPNAVFFAAGSSQTVCTDVMDENTCTRGRRFFSNAYDVGAASTQPATAPSVTMSWTTTTADNWALGATVIKQSVATAATVSVSGRVLNSSGRGAARARVQLTGANGETRYALTNFFGYYRFEQVVSGETYIFNVESKSYKFAPRILTVTEDLSDLNFYF